MEPKIIEIPGIPGKLQEQTLDQFLSVLTPDHLARKQLDEIRNQALRSVELSTQLMQANDKILELQRAMMNPPQAGPVDSGWLENAAKKAAELLAPENKYKPDPELTPPDGRSGPWPQAECPTCKKLVSTAPGPWASHQRNQHPDNQAPRPV